MGKISENHAHIAAKKIVEPIQEKRSAVEKEIQEYVTKIYKESLPAKVLKAWNDSDLCSYIISASSIKLYGHGFSNRNVNLIGKLPRAEGAEYYLRIDLTAEQAAVLQPLENEKEDLKKKYDITLSEVQNSILTLGTHKRIQEEFPEAYKFLPGVTRDTALMVQLDPVREKVRCLTSPEKEKKCIDQL